jgi:hypothetical protein
MNIGWLAKIQRRWKGGLRKDNMSRERRRSDLGVE